MVVDQKKKNEKNVKGYEFLNKVAEGWLSGLKRWFAKPKQGYNIFVRGSNPLLSILIIVLSAYVYFNYFFKNFNYNNSVIIVCCLFYSS